MYSAKQNYEKAYATLLSKIKKGVLNETLKADVIINKIFQTSHNIKINKDIYNKAIQRMRCHNPPGKDNDLGDALHWESLLSHVDKGKNLIIISNDSDFIDDLYKYRKKAHSFLEKEWRHKKESDLIFYKDITSFLQEHMPEFELHDEFKEQILQLIEFLRQSSAFLTTHEVVNDLNQYFDHLEDDDIKNIIDCYEENNQINWILDDEDIQDFLLRIKNLPTLPQDYKDKIDKLFEIYSHPD